MSTEPHPGVGSRGVSPRGGTELLSLISCEPDGKKKKKGCLRTCHRFWYSVDFFFVVEHHQHSFKNLILAELGEGRLGKEGLGQMVVM